MGTGYVAVSALSLWEIRNIVLVKRKYAQFISDIRVRFHFLTKNFINWADSHRGDRNCERVGK